MIAYLVAHPFAMWGLGMGCGMLFTVAFVFRVTTVHASAEHWLRNHLVRGYTLTVTNRSWHLHHPHPTAPSYTSRAGEALLPFLDRSIT